MSLDLLPPRVGQGVDGDTAARHIDLFVTVVQQGLDERGGVLLCLFLPVSPVGPGLGGDGPDPLRHRPGVLPRHVCHQVLGLAYAVVLEIVGPVAPVVAVFNVAAVQQGLHELGGVGVARRHIEPV